MLGLNGQPGQAIYTGANTFLDVFAQYRNNMGLAASSIDIGAAADMRHAARDDALLQRLLKNGYSGVTEREMLEATMATVTYPANNPDVNLRSDAFIHHNTFAPGFGSTISLSSPESRSWWKKDSRMSIWHNISETTPGVNSNSLWAFLSGAKNDVETLRKPETINYIVFEVEKQLMSLLLKSEEDLDVSLPVSQLSLHSFVGIDMRNRWRQVLANRTGYCYSTHHGA